MECLAVRKVPIDAKWTHEIKLDGYRLQAYRLEDQVVLYSRNENVKKSPEIAKELKTLPAGDDHRGEIAALDDPGPSEIQPAPELAVSLSPPVLLCR